MYKFLATLVVILLVVVQVLSWDRDSDDTRAEEAAAPLSAPLSPVEIERQRLAEQALAAERMKTLKQFAEVKKYEEIALAEAADQRELIMIYHRDDWNALLEQHMAEYERLVQEAKKTRSGMTECTICEGDTYMDFCLFCEDASNGKCAKCKGTGAYFGDELCPPCMGSGECFMCNGRKQMMCPFCDDGTIDLELPPPFESIRF